MTMFKRMAVALCLMFGMSAGVIAATTTEASAYCYASNSNCYVGWINDDPGTWDPYIFFKCNYPDPAWTSAGYEGSVITDPGDPYIYTTDGHWDGGVLPSQRGVYSPCSNISGSSITGLKLDSFNTPLGNVMCRNTSGYWPGVNWVQVDHEDGSWRYFPTPIFNYQKLECKATQ